MQNGDDIIVVVMLKFRQILVVSYLFHPANLENDIFISIGDALTLTVRPEEYMDQLVDYNIVKVYAVVRVIETNQFFSDEDDFTLVKPSLKVEQVGQLQVGLPL